ncbi:monoamine-oxidase A repressor R1 Zinc-finger domain-containing protein [Chloropicon primus]|uniref:Monoamine-oxidase A repressor R1 Zinc-finger domain-containing protein n=5 Tax=Chloropicon primus TaxID=1764295 RepID=A0A5B8MFG3_9CHLO|nr:monoamine-oxidase A repressor R1 Zinc-finger domain-containing protein [Chloropicon primus]UPQ98260.1 monoamine-oxidase A repressor R1 Zinc-finger domain-containing protein [Chloropicon primus]|eukprot:QDZ19051.1 monoamine-oxidase A repressor R1 Zinc-finger domain-containing protein [Chloropicon primus]
MVDTDVLKEALEMIEDMGEELSLSVSSDPDEDDESALQGVATSPESGGPPARTSEATVLDVDLPPRRGSKRPAAATTPPREGTLGASWGRKRRFEYRSHRSLQRDLLALGDDDSDDNDSGSEALEEADAMSSEEVVGEWPRGSTPSADSGRSDRDNFCIPVPSKPTSTTTRHVLGAQLKALREGQGANSEYYTHEHLRRLKEFEARETWNRLSRGSKTYCSKVHRQPCKECTTCHFCRQRTIDQKTWCPCALKKGRIVGGKSRGIICGFCLEMRYGENLDEALANPNWRCPACRDICICSGANCLRARRNLFPTNHLYHEADSLGYKSVAHYLILTHLTDGNAMPMPEVGSGRKPRKTGAALELGEEEEFAAASENKNALRQKTKIRLKREIEVMRMEFLPPAGWEALDLAGPDEPEALVESQEGEGKGHGYAEHASTLLLTERDQVFSPSLRILQRNQVEGERGSGPWHDILKQVQAVNWEELTVPQRNQRASPIVAQLPTRACVVKSEEGKASAQPGCMAMTHEELKICSSVLLILASALPERQLVPMICKKVFGRAPIVDMESSDTRAKAIIFDTSFKVLKIMQSRMIELSGALDMLVGICTTSLDNQDTLWKALSIKAEIGTTPEVKIGSLVLPSVRNRFQQLERIALVKSSLEANQELLLNALSHFAALSSSCGKIFPTVLSSLVVRMVDSRNHHLKGMRNGALGFAYNALVHLKTRWKDLSAEEKFEVADIVGKRLLNQVNGLVNMHYPIRNKEATSGDAPDVSISISEDTVTMSIHLLSQIVSFFLDDGQMTWDQASSYVFAPYASAQFWSFANSHYRSLVYKFVSKIALNTRTLAFKQQESLVRAWIVCMIDPVKGKHQVQMTDALARALKLEELSPTGRAPSFPSEIRNDKDGSLRATWMTFLSQSIKTRADLANRLISPDTLKSVCEFFQAAQKEMINSGKRKRHRQYEESACKVLISLEKNYMDLQENDSSICGAMPLVDLLAQKAAANLKGCLSLFLQSKNSKTTQRLDRLENLGLARLQMKSSSLAHLHQLLRDVARVSVRDSTFVSPSTSLHEILCAIFESIPGTSSDREPFMTALYELIASAMTPHLESSEDLGGAPRICDRTRVLSHFVLGTYMRRWLQKAIVAPRPQATIALGALRYLKVFFTQESLRSPKWMRLYLPPLIGPLIECFCCSDSCDSTSSLQQVSLLKSTFEVLSHLAVSCDHIIPEFQSAEALGKAVFPSDMNLLSNAEPLEEGKYSCCLKLLWHSALQAFLRVLSNALNVNLHTVDQINAASEANHRISILTNTLSANNRSKVFRLLGRPRPSGPIETLYAQSTRANAVVMRTDNVKYPQELASLTDLISAGFKLAQNMQNTDAGLNWVLNLVPALHDLLRLAPTRPTHIDQAYVILWSALEAKSDVSKFEIPPKPSTTKLSSPGPAQEDECGTQMYSQSDSQETVRYPSQALSQASVQSKGNQQRAVVVSTKDLGQYVGQIVNFLGYLVSRDPKTGTKEFKSQKRFLCLTLGDRNGSVKLILAGGTAQDFAAALDKGTSLGTQILVIKGVKVFQRKDNGQILLQGLPTTKKHLNPEVKAVRALRAWVESKQNREIQEITGTQDSSQVERALALAKGNKNQAANILLDHNINRRPLTK